MAVSFVELPVHQALEPFDVAVRTGLALAQPSIPSRFFYDAVGSDLFEQIMGLPEYYLTRCEQEILETHAAEILAEAGAAPALIEFGSGNSVKTRLLLEAALAGSANVHYVPIDISSECLRASTEELSALYPELAITAFAAEYHDAIPLLPSHSAGRLFLFMGSNIGNFEPYEAATFLTTIRQHMEPADRLLVGMDLVKDQTVIHAAYNDSAGVTAAFNKNVLARVNRELGGFFELDGFDHSAPFVVERSRIEMRLVAKRRMDVRVCQLDEVYRFEEGSYIHTENSHKYTAKGFEHLADAAGLTVRRTWSDARGWFGLALLEPFA